MLKNSVPGLLASLVFAAAGAEPAAGDPPYEFVPGFGSSYSRNDSQVFHWSCSSAPQLTSRQCWQAMPGMDTASFAPISFIASDTLSATPSKYYRDSRSVYFDDMKLDGVNPATFQALNEHWARAPEGIVYDGRRRPEIDAASLEVLGSGWARDRKSAYYLGQPVAGIDAGSLRLLDADYVADATHVFYRATPIADAPDSPSFAALGATGYAKDARSVFFQGRRMAGAQAGSFVLIEKPAAGDTADCYARDAHRVYFCGKPVALGDAESFVVLDSFFAIDNDRVYFGGAPVETADRNTFRPFQPEDGTQSEVRANAEDARNWYEVVESELVVTPKNSRPLHP